MPCYAGVCSDAVTSVLEGLSQARSCFLPRRALPGVNIIGARDPRADQQATGNRLRQKLVDDVTREPVESHDKARGYEYDKNAYIIVEDEELDAIALESNHTLEGGASVPREQIDERYLDRTYYMVSNDEVGQEAFAVIREAMRDKAMVALGRVVLSKRERVIALQPWDKGLLGATPRYASEVRDASDYFDDLPDVKVEPTWSTCRAHPEFEEG